jgi:Glu-tRNA(Gln) amidotransferase subunit E-like FAD-binding protein
MNLLKSRLERELNRILKECIEGERVFRYGKILEKIEYEIDRKVDLKEIIDPNQYKGKERDLIFTGHVDFVITLSNPEKTVVFAVEADGLQHKLSKRQRRNDKIKNKIFRENSIPLFRFQKRHILPNRFGETFVEASMTQWIIHELFFLSGIQTLSPDEPEPAVPIFEHEVEYYKRRFYEKIEETRRKYGEMPVEFIYPKEFPKILEQDSELWIVTTTVRLGDDELVRVTSTCSQYEHVEPLYAADELSFLGCLKKCCDEDFLFEKESIFEVIDRLSEKGNVEFTTLLEKTGLPCEKLEEILEDLIKENKIREVGDGAFELAFRD